MNDTATARTEPAGTWQVGDDTETLAAAAARGDRESLGALYDRYVHASYRYVLARVSGDVHLAQDLTADAWTVVVRQISTYTKPAGAGGWLAWLYTILRTHVIDHHRKQARRRTVADPDVGVDAVDQHAPDPQFEASRAGLRDDVAAALETLPAAQREVLTARFWLGLSSPEIAASLGISENAVRVRQHRAVKAMGRALPGYDRPL